MSQPCSSGCPSNPDPHHHRDRGNPVVFKTFAAITATMPLAIPLALWIVYAANRDNPAAITEFTGRWCSA